jgi:hypothetical protein
MAGNIILPILSTFNAKGTEQAQQSLKDLSKSVSGMTKHLMAGYGAYRLYGAGLDFIKSSLSAANDLQRTQNGLFTVFGSMTPVMQTYVANSEKIGLSHAEVARSATLLGALFRNLNFPLAQTAAQTQKIINISADLASTYGGSTTDAITAITSAFKGIFRPLERYGVGISANMVKTELAAKGMGKLRGEALLSATMQQRYLDVVAKTTLAHGAFERQLGSLFEQEQILNAVFTDLKATIGTALLEPIGALAAVMVKLTEDVGPHLTLFFNVLAGVLTGGTGNFDGFSNSILTFIDSISALVAGLGPGILFAIQTFLALLAPIIAITTAVKAAVFSFKLMTVVMTFTKTAALKYAAANALAAGSTVAEGEAAAAAALKVEGLAAAEGTAAVASEGLAVAMASTGVGAIAVGIGVLTASLLGLSAAAGSVMVNKPSAAAEQLGNEAYQKVAKFWGGFSKSDIGDTTATARNAFVASKARDAQRNAIAVQMAKEKKNAAIKAAQEIKLQTQDQLKIIQDAMGQSGSGKAVDPLLKAANAIRQQFKNASNSVGDALSAAYKSIAGAFDVTQMGFSSDVISQNMSRFLDRLKTFQGYLKQLRGMGLDQTLYNQIASAGPINGLAVAQAFAGSPDLIGQANAAYSGVGSIAKDIAKSTLNAAQQNIYNISVDGGVGSGTTIGKGIVEAIKAYERTNGKGWRG